MVFRQIKGCRRSAEEQRFIFSTLNIWKTLPEPRREEIRELIAQIAESPLEGRAMFDVLVRGRRLSR